MMRSGVFFIFILSVLAPAMARARAPVMHSRVSGKLIQSCDAHKFETVVNVIVNGQPHQSKVRLCGVEGQSDSEWIGTLKDAIKKLDANKDMPISQREQIVTAIRSEIARLTILGAAPTLPRPSRAATAPADVPLSRDYATLPPLPVAPEGEPLPARGATLEPFPRASHVTPIIPPMGVSERTVAGAAPGAVRRSQPALAPAAAPRLSFACDTPGDLSSDAPCAQFERDTMVIVHAAEDIPTGTILEFVRNDRPQADVALDGLRRGGALRLALPAKVCAGFTSGKLELRIVTDRGGEPQPLSSEGPYSLRC